MIRICAFFFVALICFAASAQAPVVNRYAWPTLGQDRTIKLGEALEGLSPPLKKVVIWCPGEDCLALQEDLDDAFQIAGVKSDFDRRRVDSNNDRGLFVGPKNAMSEVLAATITRTTGIKAEVVDAPDDGTTMIIIGKRP